MGLVIAALVWVGVMSGLGWLTMTAWNLVMPGVFGLPALTFWQGFGLYLLVWILAGMLRGRSSK